MKISGSAGSLTFIWHMRKAKKDSKSMEDKTGKGKSLESWIWDAACSIRGAKDAPKYKDFILPLIFTKRLNQ
jgi:type I restriction-modification system DNA methylase subunit